MKKTIIHFLPDNLIACGGIKVHYQLASIECDLGFDVFIVYPSRDFPAWMQRTPENATITDLSDSRIQALSPDTTLVIGWEDITRLVGAFPYYKKVSYIQGEALFNRDELRHGVPLWVSSEWNAKMIPVPSFHIPVYIDTSVFYPLEDKSSKFLTSSRTLLVLGRKDGRARFRDTWDRLPLSIREKYVPLIADDVPEENFARILRAASVVLCTSYPEGFNLIPLEAMASGTLVVGFTGGGGCEFMKHEYNCFIAPDGDYNELTKQLIACAAMNNVDLLTMLYAGQETVERYTQQSTKTALARALNSAFLQEI